MINLTALKRIASLSEPATAEALLRTMQQLNVVFPSDYSTLLTQTDGLTAESFILYSCEDLPERNATYEVADYAPGFFTIGDDNGGTSLLLRSGKKPSPIYVVGHGDMQEASMIQVASDLNEWITNGCPTRQ